MKGFLPISVPKPAGPEQQPKVSAVDSAEPSLEPKTPVSSRNNGNLSKNDMYFRRIARWDLALTRDEKTHVF